MTTRSYTITSPIVPTTVPTTVRSIGTVYPPTMYQTAVPLTGSVDVDTGSFFSRWATVILAIIIVVLILIILGLIAWIVLSNKCPRCHRRWRCRCAHKLN